MKTHPLKYRKALNKAFLKVKPKLGTGLWDVSNSALRKGSLDSSILYEKSNDIGKFITEQKNLGVIAFNGKKAEELYDNYLKINPKIEYISLPSSSSANTHFSDDIIVFKRKIVFDYMYDY